MGEASSELFLRLKIKKAAITPITITNKTRAPPIEINHHFVLSLPSSPPVVPPSPDPPSPLLLLLLLSFAPK